MLSPKVTLERSDRVSIVYYRRLVECTIILVKEYLGNARNDMLLNKGYFSVGENAFPNVTLERSDRDSIAGL